MDAAEEEEEDEWNVAVAEKQSETYELILIGGDSGEYRLWEYEGLVRFLLEVRYWLGVARLRSLHQVNPRLVFVHRVQHQLESSLRTVGQQRLIPFFRANSFRFG